MSDQQLDELSKAIKRCQFTKIKEILFRGDARKLLPSTMQLIRQQFDDKVQNYQSYFNIIRDVGGDSLLTEQLGYGKFIDLLWTSDAELLLYLIRTVFNLGGEVLLRELIAWNKDSQFNALVRMYGGGHALKLLHRVLVWYLVKFDLFEDMYFALTTYRRKSLAGTLIKETFPTDSIYLETTALVQKLVANGFTKIPDEFLAVDSSSREAATSSADVKQETPQSSMSPLRNLMKTNGSPSNQHTTIIADLQKSLEEEKTAHASEKAAHEVTKQQLQVSRELLAQSTQLVCSSTQLLQQQSEANIGGGNSNSVSRRRQREEEEALSTLLSSGTRRTREGEEVTAVEAGEAETTTSSDPLSKEGILDQLKMMKTGANIPSALVGEIDGLIEYITQKGDDMSMETMVKEMIDLEDRVMESVLKKNDPPARYG